MPTYAAAECVLLSISRKRSSNQIRKDRDYHKTEETLSSQSGLTSCPNSSACPHPAEQTCSNGGAAAVCSCKLGFTLSEKTKKCEGELLFFIS